MSVTTPRGGVDSIDVAPAERLDESDHVSGYSGVESPAVEAVPVREWQRVEGLYLAALVTDPDKFYLGSTDGQKRRDSLLNGIWVVARRGGEDIGLAWLGERDDGWFVESVWVAPAHRREGVATTMMNHLIALAKEMDLGCLSLWVVSHNEAAEELYTKRMGFVVAGQPKATTDGREEQRYDLFLT